MVPAVKKSTQWTNAEVRRNGYACDHCLYWFEQGEIEGTDILNGCQFRRNPLCPSDIGEFMGWADPANPAPICPTCAKDAAQAVIRTPWVIRCPQGHLISVPDGTPGAEAFPTVLAGYRKETGTPKDRGMTLEELVEYRKNPANRGMTAEEYREYRESHPDDADC